MQDKKIGCVLWNSRCPPTPALGVVVVQERASEGGKEDTGGKSATPEVLATNSITHKSPSGHWKKRGLLRLSSLKLETRPLDTLLSALLHSVKLLF